MKSLIHVGRDSAESHTAGLLQDRHHGGPYLIGLAPHRAYTQADVNTINSQPTTPQCLAHPHGGPHLTGAALRRAHTHYGGDRPRRY